MADLIDREKLHNSIMILARDARAMEKGITLVQICGLIQDAPHVDAVEVVRCKDCESYNNHFSQEGFGWCEEEALRLVNDNFYCSAAKRREKDG